MARASLTLSLPGPLVAAVDGECRRLLSTRSAVVEELLREALPRRLARDLCQVVDAEVVDDLPSDAETAPGPEAVPDQVRSSAHKVAPSLPPARPVAEAGRAAP
jgi:regulator of protease activity HflC (stomatin/prohibitin superfamily)